MHKRMLHLLFAIAGAVVAASAAAATQGGGKVIPEYKIEMHSIGSGGTSASDDYVLEGTTGQWSVNIVQLGDASGYQLEGGVWAGMTQADCETASVKFSTDLSVCK